MADNAERPNPFDVLHGYMDDDASFDDNAEHLYGLLTDGTLDMHVVAELLVEAATMPILAQENMKLCAAIRELSAKLEQAESVIMEQQSGDEPKDEHRPCRFLQFPKGTVVN